jgi:1-acyl-sn-glycerol-3-phosphate acyltransferase
VMGNVLQWLRSLVFMVQMYMALAVVGVVFAPYALVSRNGAFAACRAFCRWVIWSARWMVGIRSEIRGRAPTSAVMIAAKHQSFLDILLIFNALPRGKFIMKHELRWVPVIGFYAKRMGCVAVDRSKKGAALVKMVRDVTAGAQDPGQLIIFSQGTRVAPGARQPYLVGTGVLYRNLGQTCVPVATNVGLFWPRSGIRRKPGLAVVEFLDPIAPGMPRRAFMQQLEQVIESGSDALMQEAGFERHADD